MSTKWPSDAGVSFGVMRMWDTNSTSWEQLNPASGSYSWTNFDAVVSKAAASGQKVTYTFGRTPYWANPTAPNTGCNYSASSCYAPDDLDTNGTGTNANFKAFVSALEAHVVAKGWTNVVTSYEIWNEVNNAPFWRGTPQQLVRMAYDARAIIHATQSSATILTPSTCNCSGSPNLAGYNSTAMNTYLGTAVTYGGSTFYGWEEADAIAFHPYLGAAYPETVISMISGYQGMSNRHSLPLAVTEGGWGPNKYASLAIGGSGDTSCSSTDMAANIASSTCMSDMVAFMGRSLVLLASQGVTEYDWYQWDNTSQYGGGTEYYSSAVTPAGVAYNSVYHWLVGSAFSGACTSTGTSGSQVWSCPLTMPGGSGKLIWTQAASATTTMPWAGNKLALDGSSTAVANGASVTIGPKPVLLRNF